MEYQNFIKSKDVDINKVSKILAQYLTIKRQNPDSIIFFRLGDFYETYFEDAVILSKICSVLLTKRKFTEIGEIPMAGVPKTGVNIHIAKLIGEKYKVSIVEQVQTKEEVKKGDIIKREVIRTYSPGTLIDEEFLESSKNNFIASILENGSRYGFSYADISTGDFFITEGSLNEILCELSKVAPSELLLKPKTRQIEPFKVIPDNEPDICGEISSKYRYTLVNEDYYTDKTADNVLLEYPLGLKCANAIVNYAKFTQKNFMPKLDVIKKYSISSHLIMNSKTRENLELNRGSAKEAGARKKFGSIFWAVDNCKTPMGKRLLALWINEPLTNKNEIEKRYNAVDELILARDNRKKLREILGEIADISRLSSKLSNGTITPKELLSIKTSLGYLNEFYNTLKPFNSSLLKSTDGIENLLDFKEIIERTIKEEPGHNIRTGGIIKKGANGQLDKLLEEACRVENDILEYEKKLAETLENAGIRTKNLKISYAKNGGYSIEVQNQLVAGFLKALEGEEGLITKQKLSQCEKFTTRRLMELEEKLLSLKLKAYDMEYDTFLKLREYAKELTEPIRAFSDDVSRVDVLCSFAEDACEFKFLRPKISDGEKYCAKNAKNPVLARLLTLQNKPISPMDVDFDDLKKIKILTGSNMSGKSTYLRQLGALIIMAQAGSFVPAEDFELSIIDKIFARMGSFDDTVNNSSAFMCEMQEMAELLRDSTQKSLILLDETGVSTSYIDGMAVSYGVIKYISEKIGAKTILATHFQALNILENEVKNVKNYRIVFDKNLPSGERRLETGVSTSSDGLNVAKSAGLPPYAIECSKNFKEKFSENTHI